MRLTALLILAGTALLAILLWQSGTLAEFAAWARLEQRDLQNALARSVRAARAGEPGVVWGLLTASALYGLVHAVGPGHGKFLIGGAAAASRRTASRMALIGLGASVGQALTAILLVYGGMGLVEMGSRWAVGTAEDILAPASHLAIGLIGLVLVWRGLRGLRAATHSHEHHHDHDQSHDGACGCGHKHAPTAAEAEALSGWRDILALTGSIAIRPCTGAVIVLVIAWKSGLQLLGAGAALAMAAGTGTVVAAVALGSVWLRETTFRGAGQSRVAAVAPALQCGAGGLIVLFSTTLLLG